jgi:hypothetical protein
MKFSPMLERISNAKEEKQNAELKKAQERPTAVRKRLNGAETR